MKIHSPVAAEVAQLKGHQPSDGVRKTIQVVRVGKKGTEGMHITYFKGQTIYLVPVKDSGGRQMRGAWFGDEHGNHWEGGNNANKDRLRTKGIALRDRNLPPANQRQRKSGPKSKTCPPACMSVGCRKPEGDAYVKGSNHNTVTVAREGQTGILHRLSKPCVYLLGVSRSFMNFAGIFLSHCVIVVVRYGDGHTVHI